MHLPPVKRELNINTIISVVGFLCVLGGFVWTTAQRDADLSTMSKEVIRIDQRTTTLEASTRKIENLEYRITVQEQGAQTLALAVEDLKESLADQGADLRVIREIVTRLDQKSP